MEMLKPFGKLIPDGANLPRSFLISRLGVRHYFATYAIKAGIYFMVTAAVVAHNDCGFQMRRPTVSLPRYIYLYDVSLVAIRIVKGASQICETLAAKYLD